jgi:Glycosyl transferases group 1
MMRESRIRLLTLHARYADTLSYLDDWLDAVRTSALFEPIVIDIALSDAHERLNRALGESDAVVVLHSTNGDRVDWLDRCVPALANRSVPLLTFVGNELNLPGIRISEKRRVLSALRPEWIATQLLLEGGEYLFGDLATRGIVAIPHALNTTAFVPGLDDRPIDVGSRFYKYVPHIGDNDRNRVVQAVAASACARGMKVDISGDRFDRRGWADFLQRSKGTVSTEAGSWFLEKDDATVEAVRDHVRRTTEGIVIGNDSRWWPVAHVVPQAVRPLAKRILAAVGARYETTVNETHDFDEIQRHFFEGKPRPSVYGKCISSRHFDAIGTKTCQILLRGRFNDILIADRHYIAIDPELSNLADALSRFSDPTQRSLIVEEAYQHVMDGHTYAHRMQLLYDILQGAHSARTAPQHATPPVLS